MKKNIKTKFLFELDKLRINGQALNCSTIQILQQDKFRGGELFLLTSSTSDGFMGSFSYLNGRCMYVCVCVGVCVPERLPMIMKEEAVLFVFITRRLLCNRNYSYTNG